MAGSDTSTSRGADQLVAQHSAIKMLASRTVFTRDISTTIRIRVRSDFGLAGSGINFPDFKPIYISARCSLAGQSLPGYIYDNPDPVGFWPGQIQNNLS